MRRSIGPSISTHTFFARWFLCICLDLFTLCARRCSFSCLTASSRQVFSLFYFVVRSALSVWQNTVERIQRFLAEWSVRMMRIGNAGRPNARLLHFLVTNFWHLFGSVFLPWPVACTCRRVALLANAGLLCYVYANFFCIKVQRNGAEVHMNCNNI